MTRYRLGSLGFGCFSVATLAAALANAQSTGFAIDRFEPSDRGSDWFTGDSLDFRGKLRPAIGVVGDWGYKPLVLYRNGDEHQSVIRHQVFAHVGAALVVEDILRFSLSMPVLVYQKSRDAVVGGTAITPSGGAAAGDLRLGAAVNLVGAYRSPFSLAAGVWGYIPTGSRDAFAGDGKVRLVPHVLAAGDLGPMAYAVRLGMAWRPQDQSLAGSPVGSELLGGASLGVRFDDGKWLIGPELSTSTVVGETDAFFAKLSTPLEAILGIHFMPTSSWRFGLGGGPGMTRGFGSPEWRTVASVEWSGAVEEEKKVEEPQDRDLDGVLDPDDACVDVPGVRTDDPKTNGCPAPKDTDGDGIMDPDDACVDVKGVASDDPKKHGCPIPDTDGDGILDPDDACVDEKGVASDDPKKHGCPIRDTDEDGILDDVDACPKDKGPANTDPKKHGCPKAVVVEGKIRILERVEFETGKARILPQSEEILSAVKKVLDEHPRISKVSVEGHTDSRAADAFNLDLSKRRAAAVVKWLVSHGIDVSRLTSQGFGETRPIESNDTEEGRQNNRRVEFRILAEDGNANE